MKKNDLMKYKCILCVTIAIIRSDLWVYFSFDLICSGRVSSAAFVTWSAGKIWQKISSTKKTGLCLLKSHYSLIKVFKNCLLCKFWLSRNQVNTINEPYWNKYFNIRFVVSLYSYWSNKNKFHVYFRVIKDCSVDLGTLDETHFSEYTNLQIL